MPKNPFCNKTFHKHIDCLNILSTALICLFWPSASPCEIQSWHEDHCRCWSQVFVQLMSFSQSHLELGKILLLQHLGSENLRKMKATLLPTIRMAVVVRNFRDMWPWSTWLISHKATWHVLTLPNNKTPEWNLKTPYLLQSWLISWQVRRASSRYMSKGIKRIAETC